MCVAFQEWGKIPTFDFLIIASTDETSIVWRKRDTANRASMTSKTLNEVTGLNVPNTDYAIHAASSDEPPVMRDRDIQQCGILTLCSFSLKNLIAVSVQIPDSSRAIGGAGDNESTIL